MAVKIQFQVFVVLAAIAVGFISVKFLDIYNKENKKPPHAQSAGVMDIAPLDASAVFYDLEGNAKTLSDFKGHVTLVNLWATWCPPCVAELPSLDRLQAMLKKEGLKVAAISLDRKQASDVTAFLQARNIEYLSAYWDQDRQIALKWKYGGIPVSYLLDAQGNVIKRYEGPYEWTEGVVLEDIRKALAR